VFDAARLIFAAQRADVRDEAEAEAGIVQDQARSRHRLGSISLFSTADIRLLAGLAIPRYVFVLRSAIPVAVSVSLIILSTGRQLLAQGYFPDEQKGNVVVVDRWGTCRIFSPPSQRNAHSFFFVYADAREEKM
jgi:hypothetical protein